MRRPRFIRFEKSELAYRDPRIFALFSRKNGAEREDMQSDAKLCKPMQLDAKLCYIIIIIIIITIINIIIIIFTIRKNIGRSKMVKNTKMNPERGLGVQICAFCCEYCTRLCGCGGVIFGRL